MIDIRHLYYSYRGTFPALRDVCCSMERGHFVAIAGPNGSGKSTLIKCICGILNVKEGSILIDNRPVGSYQPHLLARTVAYIPQNENGRVLNTVFDTVLTGRKPYIHWRPSDTDLNAVADILKLLNIESLSMRNINELSGGQQQIVFIARALAQNPKILLLDEPTANLDLRHQLKVMELLKKLAGDGLTILMSMHDVNMAIRYADYMMMLKDGQLLSYGTKDVITRENIENLYGVKVDFIHHNDRVHIIPCGLTVHQTD